MIDVSELHVHDVIAVLMRTRLSEGTKNLVIQAQTAFQQHGHLPTRAITCLRSIYTRHARQIRMQEVARERGRISLAKERTNLNDRRFRKIREHRMDKLAESVNDLGI